MANALYDLGRNKFARGEIAWLASGGDGFRAYLIDVDDYTVNLATDEFLDDIAAAAKVAFVALTPIDPAAGVVDAADAAFTAVSGDQCEALVIAKWSGDEATSPLIAYIDSATGLPVLPNGGNINIGWDNGANKIFKL